MPILVDTCIVNYYLKKSNEWPDYEHKLNDEGYKNVADWVISFATVQELWAFSIEEKQYKKVVESFITQCKIVNPTVNTAYIAALISTSLIRRDRKWHDIWIIATAIDKSLPLVTNDNRMKKLPPPGYSLALIT